ncbi:glutathione transferase GST 23-like [Phoenix dactylifera]|uniref:Glutathione S-transferase n=1 Tax=Phoenix dactylifera TaxID=42345 RepID=A0A8B8ZQ25_PHODC|nr:glutathione transferase GST 23-like [Phoenix dactylifera]
MEGAPLKLHGMWASFYVHRVQLVLHLKGVEYEYIEEDLSNKSRALLLQNPVHKKVPVLLHGDRPIAESTIIIEYIDEFWREKPILPTDPYERAVVRFWCHFVDDTLRPSFGAILRSSAEGQGAAVDNFCQNLEFLEAELRDGFFKGRKFFGGGRIGLLDIVMGCGLYWNSASEDVLGLKIIDQESFPFFTSWFESFNEAKEVKEVIPPTEKLVEYVKGLLQKMFN